MAVRYLIDKSNYCRCCGREAVQDWLGAYCVSVSPKAKCDLPPRQNRIFCEHCGHADPGPLLCEKCLKYPLDLSQVENWISGDFSHRVPFEKAIPLMLGAVIVGVAAPVLGTVVGFLLTGEGGALQADAWGAITRSWANRKWLPIGLCLAFSSTALSWLKSVGGKVKAADLKDCRERGASRKTVTGSKQ
jgi:hypothetical protein